MTVEESDQAVPLMNEELKKAFFLLYLRESTRQSRLCRDKSTMYDALDLEVQNAELLYKKARAARDCFEKSRDPEDLAPAIVELFEASIMAIVDHQENH